MKSRIVHVIDHTGAGGAQVMVLQFIQKLQDDYDFFLINLGGRGHFSERCQLLDITRICTSQVSLVRLPQKSEILISFCMTKWEFIPNL
jgi:hypothetical protein